MEYRERNFEWLPTRSSMLARVFVDDIRDAVSSIQESSGFDMLTSLPHGQERAEHLQHIREFISGPMAQAPYYSYYTTLLSQCPQLRLLGEEDYISTLQTLLCDDELKEELDSNAPGLRCRAFYIAIWVAHVSVDDEGALGPYCLTLAY